MNSKITNIQFYKKTKQIIISLKEENLLSFSSYIEIKNQLVKDLEIPSEFKLILKINYQNMNEVTNDFFEEYYLYILENNFNLKKVLENTRYQKEGNKIEYFINFKYEQKILDMALEKLKIEFSILGIKNLNFQIKLKENKNDNKKKLEERVKEFEQKEIENDKVSSKNISKKGKLVFGQENAAKIFNIKDILDPDLMLRNVDIEGIIFNKELRELKKSSLLTIMVKDATGTIICKSFTGFGNQKPTYADLNSMNVGMKVKITGKKTYDRYINDEVIEMTSLKILSDNFEITEREDQSEIKRIELHLHSKMSRNNGVSSMEDYALMAKKFGHEAIAITDHDGVQGFVDLEKASKKHEIKPIYGVESVVVDKPNVVFNPTNINISDSTYTVFDLETTGLSANFNKIIEIGAVKIQNGEILERYQKFIKIDEDLSDFTTELTGITNQDLQGGVSLEEGIKSFKKFYKGTILVAHNATFDYQFLNKNEIEVLGNKIEEPILDTLELSRILNPENTFHSLKILSKKYGVPIDHNSHHRADYDSEKLSEILILMLKQIKEDFPNLKTLESLNETGVNKTRGVHELLYVKNQDGLANLYELISRAHTEDYLLEPRIRREYLEKFRNNLLVVGSGCIKSKIVDYYLNKREEDLRDLISYYDYIDINPSDQYVELIKNGTFKTKTDIEKMHQKIIKLAKEEKTNVFASSNAHFTEPDLYLIKEILISKDYKPEKIKKDKESGKEYEIDKERFKKILDEKEIKYKNQYYHTTDEMMQEFMYLSDKDREEIVILNTHKLLNETTEIKIIPDKLYTPTIDGVEEKLTNMVWNTARRLYGEKLPKIVEDRINKELNSIIKYGFSVIYYISHKLVKHSLDNGYLVGSRGSVGSSIVATFMDITEINPLPAHYICPNCQNSEFFTEGEYASGFDLPDKKCSNCQGIYRKDGQDIPFETFLGFKGDKVPDIDLNFSGDFQAKAHDFVRSRDKLNDPELFDTKHAYRAGTIGTIAERTAFAYTKNYFELLDKPARKSDILLYSKECEGIKRTTGQHPGGIIVVPEELEIYKFTAVQYPANDIKQAWQTTHFDFHSIHDNLLKLDILGHDDPTMLKKLYDLTGVDPKTIDVSDQKIMELFSSIASLNMDENSLIDLGTSGIPEFGTDFVMGMLKDTKPKTFSELVQISGLSHGTDVWLGNAKDLIDNNIATISEVIGCRDDIMVYLMYQGVEASSAFSIMENVRKGRGLTNGEIKILKESNVPSWYIDSCQKIKYMFPKAHAAAYVLMALRIAYYKVYYPLEYYCAYFSSRISDFDPIAMIKGEEALLQRIEDLQNYDNETSDVKKKSLLNSLKMSYEMLKRGFKFLRFDLVESKAFEFVLNKGENGLIMPFGIIEGLGEKEAIKIVEERENSMFSTKEDLKKRTRIKNKSLEQLEYFEVLDSLEESNQMRLF